MIIKSMSRKSKSFSQLYDYFCREEATYRFSRNTYSNAYNREKTLKEFYNNARYLKGARGNLYLYHEVISLDKNNLSSEQEQKILLDLVDKYISLRAMYHLSFGVVHQDKDNTHVHLMISANEIGGLKRIRLSKKEYAYIQKELENYKNQRYPELRKTALYQGSKNLSKAKQKEQEITIRGATTIKQEIYNNLQSVFNKASSLTYLNNHLKNLGYKVYKRGKTISITYEGKNYRLKTLGLEQQYKNTLSKLERIKEREIKRDKTKEDRNINRDR